MRIFRGRIEPTVKQIVQALIHENLIEVVDAQVPEVQKDLEAVLFEYIRVTREIEDRSKEIMDRQGLDHGQRGRIRRRLAQDKRVGIDEEALDYIVGQMVETLDNSNNVDEVFGELHHLNRIIAPILKEQMKDDDDLDLEVRSKIRHLENKEGSVTWDVEYQRIKQDLERLKKLD
jgi:hypothetical protein